MRKLKFVGVAATLLILTAWSIEHAHALPTFQVYADGSSAGTNGADEETWFVPDNPFTLRVVGAYGPNTLTLTGVTLLISVPEGETGTLSITPAGSAELLTITGTSSVNLDYPTEVNPLEDANIDILSNETGNSSGFDGYSTLAFLPFDPNSHYPLKDGVSDFLIYDIFRFDEVICGLNDYNADSGIITQTTQCGDEKVYEVSFSGFSSLHIDVYGLETDLQGGTTIRTTWEQNPGSHDVTTTVPEPGSLLLLGTGLIGLGILGRKKFKGNV